MAASVLLWNHFHFHHYESFMNSTYTMVIIGNQYHTPMTPWHTIAARTGVLPRNVRFDCTGTVFCVNLHVVRLPKRMTNIFPVISTHVYLSSFSSSSSWSSSSSTASLWNPMWNPKETLSETLCQTQKRNPKWKPEETLKWNPRAIMHIYVPICITGWWLNMVDTSRRRHSWPGGKKNLLYTHTHKTMEYNVS